MIGDAIEINWQQGMIFIPYGEISHIVQVGVCVQLITRSGKIYHLADYDSRETAQLAYSELRQRLSGPWFGTIDMLDVDKLRNLPGGGS